MKMTPAAYVKKHEANEHAIKRKLMEPSGYQGPELPAKKGRKSKKEKDVEDRAREQMDFLLFLEKNKND
jgi:hypothetical protein